MRLYIAFVSSAWSRPLGRDGRGNSDLSQFRRPAVLRHEAVSPPRRHAAADSAVRRQSARAGTRRADWHMLLTLLAARASRSRELTTCGHVLPYACGRLRAWRLRRPTCRSSDSRQQCMHGRYRQFIRVFVAHVHRTRPGNYKSIWAYSVGIYWPSQAKLSVETLLF